MKELQVGVVCLSFFFGGMSFGHLANDDVSAGCRLGITALSLGIVSLFLGM